MSGKSMNAKNKVSQPEELLESEQSLESIEIKKKYNLKNFSTITLAVIALASILASYYFYQKYSAIKADPNAQARRETEALVSAVGKLIELPEGESPTVATISAKEKLRDQNFFHAAENGDILLAYTTSMKAILYRPSTNKIINVAPITINNQPTAQQDKPAVSVIQIAYYNGTETVGLAGLAEKKVKERYPDYQTTALANASKKDYKGTLIVDLSGKYTQEAADIARLLGGKTGVLPAGESVPKADILIISGN